LANIVGHALVGCGQAEASGGKCGAGAFAGASGSLAGPFLQGQPFVARLVVTATLGGLSAEAAGGKFANGALTAAYGYIFNEVALVCRGVSGMFGAANHCGLFVTDDGDKTSIRSQFSLGNEKTTFNTVQRTSDDDRQQFVSGTNTTWIAPPNWLTSKQFDGLVIELAGSYQAPTYQLYIGPNSNSAAAFPLIMLGVPLSPINGGWLLGTPALNYWDTHPYNPRNVLP
jgi:hypothetical protein